MSSPIRLGGRVLETPAPTLPDHEERVLPDQRNTAPVARGLPSEDWRRFQIDTARSMAQGACTAPISCRDAQLRLARRMVRDTELPGTQVTIDEAADQIETTLQQWVRESPVYGVPLYATALALDGFDLDTERRWASGDARLGLEVGPMASEFQLFTQFSRRFSSETSASARAQYNPETEVYSAALDLTHHSRDGRWSMVLHADASSSPYRVDRYRAVHDPFDSGFSGQGFQPVVIRHSSDETDRKSVV